MIKKDSKTKKQSKKELEASKELAKKEIESKVEEDFVSGIMKELMPKYKFLPESPYKTIVGISDANYIDGKFSYFNFINNNRQMIYK